MSTLIQRIRQGHMLNISHRIANAECSIAELERLTEVDYPNLLVRMEADAKQPSVLSKATVKTSRASKIMQVVCSYMLFSMGVVMMENGGMLSTLLCLGSSASFVLGLIQLKSKEEGTKSKSKVLENAMAEVWLMQNASEARMLHARRALRLIIGYRKHFAATQDECFNAMLNDTVSLYLYLLRYAVQQPRMSSEVQQYISRTLPRLVYAVLDTRMRSGSKQERNAYVAECRDVMAELQYETMKQLDSWTQLAYREYTASLSMNRQFRVMRGDLIHDGLLDEHDAEYFAEDSFVSSQL